MDEQSSTLGRDLLRGAEEIAEFIFGDPKQRRRVYHLAATSNLPVFKLGSMLCARRSVLLAWVTNQETRYGSQVVRQVQDQTIIA